MSRDINVIVLTGRLTRDPELRTTPNGKEITEFCLAVNRTHQQKGDDGDADFYDIKCFKDLALQVEQLGRKGRKVAVEGRLRQDRWKGSGGESRSKIYVIANEVQFLDRPREETQADAPADDSYDPFKDE